jgi:hypothetical protein
MNKTIVITIWIMAFLLGINTISAWQTKLAYEEIATALGGVVFDVEDCEDE